MNIEPGTEKRQGKTGIWHLVERTPTLVMAVSEWGSVYGFHEAQWLELPIISEPKEQNAPTSRPQ